MPTMPAITHVAVTVNDLAVSVPWYTQLFGSEPVLDENTGPFHHTVYLLGNTLFGVHGFPELQSTDSFEEHRPGLDHVAFGCANRGRTRGMGGSPQRAGHRPRRHRRRPLRLGPVVPRSRQHRARTVLPAVLSDPR